jgi:raffinose/stachyose/melibiose transport system substrate-binding protein
MKKLNAIIVVCMLLLSMVILMTGCTPGGGKVTVKTMAYGDNSNQEGQNWVRIVTAFEKENPNIKIDYEMLYDEAYHQKVVARLAAGDVPALAYMGADARWGAPWKEGAQQFDMKPFIDPKYYEMKMIPPMGPNGEIFEIPLGTSNITTVLYFNQDLAKTIGVDTPKTYEDMVAMVPKAKKAGLDVVSIDGADGWAWGSCFMSCIIGRLSGDADWVSKAASGANKFTDQVFVDSLGLIAKMVKDGVISAKMTTVDYGANISNFSNKKALFMIQGQWAAGGIDPKVADTSLMMAWPKLPGEKDNMAGSVAAAIQVGYGITKAGAADAKVRDAALKFIKYFYSEKETTQRLRDGAIVAPILKDYKVPADLPSIVKQKVTLANTALYTNVIDAFLSGAPNDALNAGMQKIAGGKAKPEEVAAEVQKLLEKK